MTKILRVTTTETGTCDGCNGESIAQPEPYQKIEYNNPCPDGNMPVVRMHAVLRCDKMEGGLCKDGGYCNFPVHATPANVNIEQHEEEYVTPPPKPDDRPINMLYYNQR